MTNPGSADTIAYLRERLTRAPRAVVVLGSGLGGIAEEIGDAVRLPYAEIPGFPVATVGGHAGALVAGIWQGVEVVAMQGRFHLYEGWEPEVLARPLRALSALGAEYLIVTNAAGGINPVLRPGDLMLIADHINFMFRNPLIGPTARGESRFPDMSEPYDRKLRDLARDTADDLRIPLTPGVFAGVLGPSYETPAEIDMLRRLGADAVGMSTVPEVLAARGLGMRVLGVSCIANLAASRGGAKLTHDEVLQVGAAAGERLAELLGVLLPRAIPPNLPSEAAS